MLTHLSGRRVLVVEDEYFIATELASAVVALGATVLGPAATIERALELLETPGGADLAVLDINLKGQTSFQVADVLRARGIPFMFATGYDEMVVPAAYRDVPRWEKPFDAAELVAKLASVQHPEGQPAPPPQIAGLKTHRADAPKRTEPCAEAKVAAGQACSK